MSSFDFGFTRTALKRTGPLRPDELGAACVCLLRFDCGSFRLIARKTRQESQ
jgi:hypothetical protein